MVGAVVMLLLRAAKPVNKEQRKENLMIFERSRKSFSQNKRASHTDVRGEARN